MNDLTYVVELEATPSDGLSGGASATGAYANVYVVATTAEEAVARAQSELAAAGWNAGPVTHTSRVDSETFEPGSDGLAYYNQCQFDGAVVVLHTWREQH